MLSGSRQDEESEHSSDESIVSQNQLDFEQRKEMLIKRCDEIFSKKDRYKGFTKSKLRWAKIFGGLRAVIKLNKLCKDIKTYGSSEELLNTKNRSKKAIEQAVDPSLEKYVKPDIEEELPWGIISPTGTFMGYWSIVLFVLMCYVSIIMPIKMAFIEDDTAWFTIDLIVDILFICDIIICCNTAFYDANENLVSTRREIVWEYLKGWMLFDIAASFPSSLLDYITSGSINNDILKFARLPRLYKLIRATRLFKMYKIASKGGFMESAQDYLRITTGIIRVVSFFLTIIICNHIAACMWVYIANMDGSPDTWIHRCGYTNADGGTLYLAAFYWSYQILSTLGYGDIPPYTTAELLISIIWMMVGAGVFSMNIGNLSSVLTSMDTGTNNLSFKIATLYEFCHDAKLGSDLRRKLKNAVEYSHKHNLFSWVDKQKIFDELPPHLKCEVAAQMYDGVISKIHFFNEKDGTFTALVVPLLQPLKTVYREIIYKKHDHPFSIFFLVDGRVSYLMHNTLPYKCMVTGSYFGEQEVIMKTKRKYNMRSERNCDLLTLSKSVFSTVIEQEYNEVYEEMKELAMQRKEELVHAKTRMRNYLITNKDKLVDENLLEEEEFYKYMDSSSEDNDEEIQNNMLNSDDNSSSANWTESDEYSDEDENQKQNKDDKGAKYEKQENMLNLGIDQMPQSGGVAESDI